MCSPNCRQFVDHGVARGVETCPFFSWDFHAQKWCLNVDSRKRAYGEGTGSIEKIVLHDDGWTRFAGIHATGDEDDFTASDARRH